MTSLDVHLLLRFRLPQYEHADGSREEVALELTQAELDELVSSLTRAQVVRYDVGRRVAEGQQKSRQLHFLSGVPRIDLNPPSFHAPFPPGYFGASRMRSTKDFLGK
jgi:hypothetical protein